MSNLVTVYIITYNRLSLLKRAIDSVRTQSYKNIEIIIVDDCSDDGTHKYLHMIAREDLRIRIFINEQNRGACYSRNVAIKNSTGDYITGLDDDDYFLKDRVSNFVEKSELLEDYAFLFSENLWKNTSGIKKTKINKYFPKIIRAEDLLFVNFAGNQIFTKSSILKSYNFDINLLAWQDLECWYRILRQENKTALKINTFDYVQDISHEYGRISSAKREKIYKTLDYFICKYSLNFLDSTKVHSHLFTYGIKTIYYIPTSIMLIVKYKSLGCLLALRNFREMLR